MAIKQMNEEELKQEYINSYLERFKSYEHQDKHRKIEKEFLKRLSIDKFKKILIEKVNNTSFRIENFEQDKIDDLLRNTLINLINNIK